MLVSTAYPQPNTKVISPEVLPDRSVIFRVRAAGAKEVLVQGIPGDALAMQKSEDGIWTLHTPPLEPDYYSYSFKIDGVSFRDPNNSKAIPNLAGSSSEVHIPGTDVAWELTNVPHGELHHHFFHSKTIGDDRDYYVYTPPGYDANSNSYPVLYLLHGFSDGAEAWTEVGRANLILDNLIAQSKLKPMLLVMPLGYGVPVPVIFGPNAKSWAGNDALHAQNLSEFRTCLLTEIVPAVENQYRVDKSRNARAIAGLSMGGSESLSIGLNNAASFGWVGSFSMGGLRQPFEEQLPTLDPSAAGSLRLLWIACGTEDRLHKDNVEIRDWLVSKHIPHVDIDTPGAHTWMVWRRNLAAFTPLLFR